MAAPKSFVLASLLVFTLHIFYFSSQVLSSASSLLSLSRDISPMKGLMKLEEGCVNNPEDIAVDSDGVLYTATRDGWIKKIILENDTLINWKHLDTSTLLGITTTKEGDVIACDDENGLLKISEAGVEVLDPNVRFSNDVIEASDGTLYFTVSTTKYKPEEYYKDLVDGTPHGQLLKYDPKTKKTTVLHEDFYFANGVALPLHENFVIVCESWKFRCSRYWLKGPLKGTVDGFIENLPGGPDNINLNPDGSFWIGLIMMNQTGMHALQNCWGKYQLLDAYPGLIGMLSYPEARVVKVNKFGKVIKEFSDKTTYKSFICSAFEFEDNLYLSNLLSNFIGKLPLNDIAPELPQLDADT